MMNCLRKRILPQPPRHAAASSTTMRLLRLLRRPQQGPPLHRRYCTSQLRSSPCPWYHDPRKVAAATALVAGGAAVAVYCRYGETVPVTGRTHLVLHSHRQARELDGPELAKLIYKVIYKEHASEILDRLHLDSVRLRHITAEIVTAVYCIKKQQLHGLDLNWVDGLHWEVVVVRDDIHVNAMCSAAGKIIVSTGLLHHFKTDAEIATILAHEVGHVIARHSSEMVTHWYPITFLLQRHETEADHIGIMLLAAAGFNPRIALHVLYKLAKMEPAGSRLQNYLSTHPPSIKRLQLLSQPKVMEEALELYGQVRPRLQPNWKSKGV